MKKLSVLSIILLLVIGTLFCCANNLQKNSKHIRPGIPKEAVFADETELYEIFIKEEKPAKDDFDIPVVSLWTYNKSYKKSSKLLTTVKPEKFFWYLPDDYKGFDVPINSINAIHTVTPVDSTRIIIQGVPDLRNTFSYIIDIPNKKAIYIPCNAGIIGFTSEENLIIGQSYRYVSDPEIAGRYTYIQIFDWDGNQVADLDLERVTLQQRISNHFFDIDFKTKFILESYKNDADFKFPVEGKQCCWEYIYSFEDFSPEDTRSLNNLITVDKNWKKTDSGYHYLYIDKDYGWNIYGDIDLKNKRFVYIHGQPDDDQ